MRSLKWRSDTPRSVPMPESVWEWGLGVLWLPDGDLPGPGVTRGPV